MLLANFTAQRVQFFEQQRAGFLRSLEERFNVKVEFTQKKMYAIGKLIVLADFKEAFEAEFNALSASFVEKIVMIPFERFSKVNRESLAHETSGWSQLLDFVHSRLMVSFVLLCHVAGVVPQVRESAQEGNVSSGLFNLVQEVFDFG